MQPDFYDRLENWARWARDHHGSVGHCLSIEHRYRSPQVWYPEQPRTEIDHKDALTVEKAIRVLPLDYQKPLTMYHVTFRAKKQSGQIPAEIVAMLSRFLARRYKVVINRSKVPERIRDAEFMVCNRLAIL